MQYCLVTFSSVGLHNMPSYEQPLWIPKKRCFSIPELSQNNAPSVFWYLHSKCTWRDGEERFSPPTPKPTAPDMKAYCEQDVTQADSLVHITTCASSGHLHEDRPVQYVSPPWITVNSLYCWHPQDSELMSLIARVHNSKNLFQSNVCNLFFLGI